MSLTLHPAAPAAEHATQAAMLALHKALAPRDAEVTPATETQLQNALYLLRQCPHGRDALARLEGIARDLRVMVAARRDGRPNLYASKLARLRRAVFH